MVFSSVENSYDKNMWMDISIDYLLVNHQSIPQMGQIEQNILYH